MLKNQQKSGRPTTNKEVVNRIEKLFNAVEFKLSDSKQSSIVTDSLKCQIFGAFSQNYKLWQQKGMGIEFVSYFHGSKILAEENEAIYRALLYFNLP